MNYAFSLHAPRIRLNLLVSARATHRYVACGVNRVLKFLLARQSSRSPPLCPCGPGVRAVCVWALALALPSDSVKCDLPPPVCRLRTSLYVNMLLC